MGGRGELRIRKEGVVKVMGLVVGMVLGVVVVASSAVWRQTSWRGGGGQQVWRDTTKYLEGKGINARIDTLGNLYLRYWNEVGDFYNWTSAIYSILQTYSGRILVSGWGNRVWFSDDAGSTWSESEPLQDAVRINSIAQAQDSTLYASGRAYDGAYYHTTVYRSKNLGEDWEKAVTLGYGMQSSPQIIVASDSTLYVSAIKTDPVGQERGMVFKSTDAGTTWDTTATLPGVYAALDLLEDYTGAIYVKTYRSDKGHKWMEYPAKRFYRFFYPPLLDPKKDWVEIFKSTDGGASWDTTGDLPYGGGAGGFVQGLDSSLYVGRGGWDLYYPVIKSTNLGETWEPVGELSERVEWIYSVLAASDGAIYVGTHNWGNVFRSRNQGDDWEKVGGTLRAQTVSCLGEDSSGVIYAGTIYDRLYKGGYGRGYVVSSVYDTGDSTHYESITWQAEGNGELLQVKVRTARDTTMTGAASWDTCEVATNGQVLSSLNSVHNGDRYIQYRVEMATDDREVTPVLEEISIEYYSGVEDRSNNWLRVGGYELGQNYPNPFNATTVIRYHLPAVSGQQSAVSLKIYNILGEEVRTLIESKQKPGEYQVVWDGRDDSGNHVASGIYICRLKAENRKLKAEMTRKMVVLR